MEAFKLEVPRYRLQCHAQVELNGFDKFSYIAELFFFFTKLSPVTLRKRTFCYGLRLLKNLSKKVLVLNNGFNNYTVYFKIRVPPSTAYLKLSEAFFIRLF